MSTVTSESPAVTYLRALDGALVGPVRTRRDLMREAGDHLTDAADAYLRAGYGREDAERRAVADFGAVSEVAPAFQVTLAVAAARRTALLLLLTLAVQPFLWDDGLELAAAQHAQAPADAWVHGVLDGLVEIGGFVAVLGAVGVLALTAVGQRWVPVGRRAARVTAWYVLAAAVLLPLLSLAMLAVTGGVTVVLVLLVLTLMVLPLAGAAASARRTLAAC